MSLHDFTCRVEAIEAGWLDGGKASIPAAAAALEKEALKVDWATEELDAVQALLIRLALLKKTRTRVARPRRETETPLPEARPARFSSPR
jgi:hypothetical protein